MTALIYYNEIDKYAALWLQNLIESNDLPRGLVDSRDITETFYTDLSIFHQCHFFAGIGGWPLALRLSRWPPTAPVWTGSCPCQPFSQSSQTRKKTGDDRHLWPDFLFRISQYKPSTIFGEQVSGPDGWSWIGEVRSDLLSLGYDFAAIELSASLVGAQHNRKRLYWVAHTYGKGLEGLISEGKNLSCAKDSTSTLGGLSGVSEGLFDPSDTLSIGEFNGVSRPVGIVRAFGNAIVPALGALFIDLFLESVVL